MNLKTLFKAFVVVFLLSQQLSFADTPLHQAAVSGTLEQVAQLSQDPDLRIAKNHLGDTALHIAARSRRLDIVQYLMSFPDLILQTNRNGDTVLHVLVRDGAVNSSQGDSKQYIELVKKLAQNPEFRFTRNRMGRTVLHLAAIGSINLSSNLRGEREEILEALLSFQDIIPLEDHKGETAFSLAILLGGSSAQEKRRNVLETFQLHDSQALTRKDSRGRVALHFAMDIRTFRYLSGKYPSDYMYIKDNAGKTVFHSAIQHGLESISLPLLLKDSQLAVLKDNLGRTSLYYAILGSSSKLFNALVNSPAISVADNTGATPLHYATKGLTQQKLELLISKVTQNDPEAFKRVDQFGASPLHYAVAKEKDDVITTYLTHCPQCISIQTTRDWTIKKSVGLQDNEVVIPAKSTPIEVAKILGFSDQLIHIYEKRLKRAVPTALISTKGSQLPRIINTSSSSHYSDRPIQPKLKTLMPAIGTSTPLIGLAPDQTAPSDLTGGASWLRMKTELNPDLENMLLLINIADRVTEAEPDQFSLDQENYPYYFLNWKEYRSTPLHLAVLDDKRELVGHLTRISPKSLEVQDINGNTPLHLAVAHKRFELVPYLMSQLSVSSIKNFTGFLAYDLAVSMNQPEIVELFNRFLVFGEQIPTYPIASARTHVGASSHSGSPVLAPTGSTSAGDSAPIQNSSLFVQVTKKTHSQKNKIPLPDNLLSLDHQSGSDRGAESGLHFKTLGPKVPFTKVSLLPDSARTRLYSQSVTTPDGHMSGTYYSLNRRVLPGSQEQFNIVLAGRGLDAFIPERTPGTRVILLLASPSEKELAQQLVRDQVDVFVLESLFYQRAPLNVTELRLVTSRRVAAFHLASFLKLNRVAVLDDNVSEIQVSQLLWNRILEEDSKEDEEGEERILNWSEIYNLVNRHYMDEYATIGMKGLNPRLIKVTQPINQFQVIDQGPYSADSSFGQKVLFFNMEKVKQAVGERFDLLFPPGVQMAQEDLFYQIYLARSGQKVGHISRKSLLYVRNQGQLAKPACLESEEWLRISSDIGLDPIHKATIQQLQVAIHDAIERAKAKKQALITEPIPQSLSSRKGKEKMDEDYPENDEESTIQWLLHSQLNSASTSMSSSTSTVTSTPVLASTQSQKRKREDSVAPIVAPRGGTGLRTDRPAIVALDEDSNWKNFGEALNRSSNPLLRHYQNGALVKLGQSILGRLNGGVNKTQRESVLNRLSQNWVNRPSKRQSVVDPRSTPTSQVSSSSQPKKREAYLGYFDLATGTGKTEIFFEMARLAALNLKGNIAIVLPTLTITAQTADRIESVEAEIKAALASSPHYGRNISVYSISSEDVAARRAAINDPLTSGGSILIFCEKSFSIFMNQRKAEGANLNDFSLVIFDEMHKLPPTAASYVKELASQPQTGVYGFSATPRKRIEMFGGPKGSIYRYTTEQALNDPAGPFLAPWKTRVMTFPQGPEAMLRLIPRILTQERLPDQRLISEGQGIIYLHHATAEKADEFAQSLIDAGIPAVAHHYKTLDSKKILQAFKEKQIRVLVALQTLREGFDAPVDWVFIAKAETKKPAVPRFGLGRRTDPIKELDRIDDWRQIRGRALRLDPTQPEKVALVIVPDRNLAEKVISLKDHPQGGMDAAPKAWRLTEEELLNISQEATGETQPQVEMDLEGEIN